MPILDQFHADPDRYDGRMPYRAVGGSGLKLPAISLGLWHNFGDDVPFATQRDILRRAFDLGVESVEPGGAIGEVPRRGQEHRDPEHHPRHRLHETSPSSRVRDGLVDRQDVFGHDGPVKIGGPQPAGRREPLPLSGIP